MDLAESSVLMVLNLLRKYFLCPLSYLFQTPHSKLCAVSCGVFSFSARHNLLNSLYSSVGYSSIPVVFTYTYQENCIISVPYSIGIVYEYIKAVIAFADGLVADCHYVSS